MTEFHAVRFYESSESMAAIVGAFLGSGFITGEPALIIARPSQRVAIVAALRSINFSIESLERSRTLVFLDASETLWKFMVHGAPDPIRFDSVVRAALTRLDDSNTGGIRIYDEMVDVLWSDGERQEALRLEGLWDQLTLERRCSLLCGHAVEHFRTAAARAVCMRHSHVVAPDGTPHPVI